MPFLNPVTGEESQELYITEPESGDESDGESDSDVDSQGNIEELIAYDHEQEAQPHVNWSDQRVESCGMLRMGSRDVHDTVMDAATSSVESEVPAAQRVESDMEEVVPCTPEPENGDAESEDEVEDPPFNDDEIEYDPIKQVAWYFVTWNNPGETFTPDRVEAILYQSRKFKYFVFQKEIGAEATPHYHITLNYKRSIKWSAVKTHFKRLFAGAQPDIECILKTQRSNPYAASKYCKKDITKVEGSTREYGEAPKPGTMGHQGNRNDMKILRDKIKNGAGNKQIFEEHTGVFLRCPGAIDKARMLYQVLEVVGRMIIWCWGVTGSGKSRWAKTQYPKPTWGNNDGTYWKMPGTLWFDGYAGQEAVVIDEFRADWTGMPIDYMLRLLGEEPLAVQLKGSHFGWVAKTVVITCYKPPAELFRDHGCGEADILQLTRRITKCMHFTRKTVDGVVVWNEPTVIEGTMANMEGWMQIHQLTSDDAGQALNAWNGI